MYSGHLARILVRRLYFLFLWNNGARKSHAAQQTPKVRNGLSGVFVDPVPILTLVRSLKINFGRRRKMQAAPKMITYSYKVVCFFSYKETFIPYFAALNKLVYLNIVNSFSCLQVEINCCCCCYITNPYIGIPNSRLYCFSYCFIVTLSTNEFISLLLSELQRKSELLCSLFSMSRKTADKQERSVSFCVHRR